MSWIEERLKREKLKQSIPKQAEQLHEELMTEIKARVEEAKKHGVAVFTKDDREFGMSDPGEGGQPKTLRVELSRDRTTIRTNTGVQLKVDLCEDNSFSLMHHAARVSIAQAAQLILEPFLFD
jgi:hypothetical protein